MNIRLSLFFLLVFLCTGCFNLKKENNPVANTYYNVDSLLDLQVTLLANSKLQLQKNYQSGEYKEESLLHMDSTKWSELLNAFRVLDLNKPSHKSTYQITHNIPDSLSNLTISQYRLKDKGDKQQLKEVRFYYLDSIRNLKKIIAINSSSSFIYSFSNLYELTFDQQEEQTILKTSSINSTQKTLFRDSSRTIVLFQFIDPTPN